MVPITLIALAALSAPRGYYRTPTIFGETVVFAAEGDLWRVGIQGGSASRLTTHPRVESNPAISPDGRWLAFNASYEGPSEVYVMPLEGGEPRRLTYGTGGRVYGWTPEGRILYTTERFSLLPQSQLVALDPTTQLRTILPLAQAAEGTYDSGGTLFFTRFARQPSETKRYQGGTAQNLWKLAPGATEAVPLTADFKGTSRNPLWWNGRLYFLSDRDGVLNVWSMDSNGKGLRQVTHQTQFDVLNPQLQGGRLVYQCGADIIAQELLTGKETTLPIQLQSDFDQLRERWVTQPRDWVSAAHLSPNGDRLVITARGQVYLAPTGRSGRLIEASRKAGVRYRNARFLPDGKSLVALSDESGEVELWQLAASGESTAPRTQLTYDSATLRWDMLPAPNGQWIVHNDKRRRLSLYSTTTKKNIILAECPDGDIDEIVWSPDSRYLVYAFPTPNSLNQLRLYDTTTGATANLTTDRYDNSNPTFSPDSRFLYFLSERVFRSSVGSPWGSRQPEPYFDRQTQVYGLALQPGSRSPFLPDNELKPTSPPSDSTTIATDGITSRLFVVPVPRGNYAGLETDGKRLLFLSREQGRSTLVTIPIGNDDPRVTTLLADATDFELSSDRKKLLAIQNGSYLVFDSNAPPDPTRHRVTSLDGWSFTVDPKEEWRQMFDDAWRLHRDYFYDPKMHGTDWKALREKYRPLMERVACREDLSDLLAQLMGELSVLHTYVSGGDTRTAPESVAVGMLGAQWERDTAKGGWRITQLYRTDPDLPEARGPLLVPEVAAAEGDIIATLNGVPTLSVPDPSALLRGQIGKQVRLTLYPGGDATKARDVIVTPVSAGQDDDLRYSAWEWDRRQRVERQAQNRLGYVHLRAMGTGDINQWQRDFYPVFAREGLIVDVRHNGGGNIDSWILEKLLRRVWMYWKPPVGSPYWNMQYAFRGPIVVLCDERTASDGEAFAEGFRRLGLGKVIGTRTWGGEVWLTSSNRLVDGGIVSAAEFGVYGPEGKWLIEGIGVEPDIVVDNLPRATFDGADAQLDRAIAHLLNELKKHPNPVPPVPPYPNKAFVPKKR